MTENLSVLFLSCTEGKIKKLDKKAVEYENNQQELNSEKEKLILKKEEMLREELKIISKKVSNSDFRISLSKVNTPIGKPAYSIDKLDACSYFVSKQIQYNIRKLYKIKQGDRSSIICQLREVLNNPFPKCIVRTDISSFYESIQQDTLFKKIEKDAYLSLSSRKIIKDILSQYRNLSGSEIGLPRGIGFSAYLAELYMYEFDGNIREHPELIFYARYVDDIIAVYAPKPNTQTQFIDVIKRESEKLGLGLEPSKTDYIDLLGTQNATFDYLGYTFETKDLF